MSGRIDAQIIAANKKKRNEMAVIKSKRNAFINHHRLLFNKIISLKLPNSKDKIVELENLEQPVEIINGKLKDYQLVGLSWMNFMIKNGMNFVLGDEMGLGKTLQIISLITYLKFNSHFDGPHLVVAPLSVIESWMTEFNRWSPTIKVMRFHASEAQRIDLKTDFVKGHYDVIITTYEMFSAEVHFFSQRFVWGLCVLDEGHKIKNHYSLISQNIQKVHSLYRIILTGTPLQNNLSELWSLFNWLFPDLFDAASEVRFKNGFSLQESKFDFDLLSNSGKLLDLIMIRRMKDVVDTNIPDKEEIIINVPISPIQRMFYKSFLTSIDSLSLDELTKDDEYDAAGSECHPEINNISVNQNKDSNFQTVVNKIKSNKSAYQKMRSLLFSLMQCCSHPFMCLTENIPGVTDNIQQTINASSKMILLDKILPTLKKRGNRVLIFAKYIKVLDMLEDYLSDRGWEYGRLDGGVGRARRKLEIKLFNKKDSNLFVFLISTRAGGLGITLTSADTVIFYDSDWNPQVDLQAMARAHRIGQTKKVTIYRLCTKDTVEERLLACAQKKLWLSMKVTEERTVPIEETLSKSELKKILKFGSNCVFNTSDSFDDFMNEDVDLLLSPNREQNIGNFLVGTEMQVDKFDIESFKPAENLRFFEGIQHLKENVDGNKEIENFEKDENGRSIRTRQERTVTINGHKVLAQTIYSNEAVPSIVTMLKAMGEEGKFKDTADLRKIENANNKFIHMDDCLVCMDGGEIYLCTACPQVFHAQCLGWKKNDPKKKRQFRCPSHSCVVCDKSASVSGGLLLRCVGCTTSYCEDHAPDDDEIEFLGQSVPVFETHLYYPGHQYYCIKCSECIKYDKLNNVDCTLPRYIPIIPETEPEMPVKIKKGKKVPKKGKSYQTKITSSNNDSVKAVTKKRKAHSLDHGDVTNLVDHNLPPANDSNESLHKVETKFDSLIKSDDKLEKTVDRTENSTSSSGAHLLN